jgi:hypothetical protein
MVSSRVMTALRDVVRIAACAAIAVGAGWSPSFAQSGTSLTSDMVGQWEFSTAGRDKTCVVTLNRDAARQGFKLDIEKGCADTLPFMAGVASWSIKGLDIVRLQDADGQPVIDMTEVESGIFEGVRPGEGVYLLQNLEAARALSKSTDQMIGDWAMVRGNGNTICGLTLTNTDAGGGNFEVYLKPRCDASVASFNPKLWRIDRGQMLLLSVKGEVWRFEADDNAQWRRVPDSADPLIMLRQ